MSTYFKVLIKGIDKKKIIQLIKDSYRINRITSLDDINEATFLDENNSAFIVYNTYIKGWVSIDLDFYESIQEHDNFLINISEAYNTTVILGYEQTTTADSRFLVLVNGQTIRYIYQKSYYNPHRILMEYNIGVRSCYEKDFDYAEVGNEILNKQYIGFCDDIQYMFKDYGYYGERWENRDEEYIHLEYTNPRINSKHSVDSNNLI